MRLWHLALALGLACGTALAASPSADPNHPTLVLPDGSVIPLPPGSRSFGPGGPLVAPDKPPIAAETAPPDEKPAQSPAERRMQRLDDLYGRLAQAKDEAEAGAIGASIEQILLRSGSDTADLLMQRAVSAIDGKSFATAEAILDKVIALQPRWAEAWNKRATVRYLDNDDVGSMNDIGQVLTLEPRHFGAISGMGMILHRNGNEKAALTVLRRAAAIDPQDPQVKALIDELTPAVEGRDL